MSAQTKKEVIVEYPIKVVYETMLSLFPLKYYQLNRHNNITYNLTVTDSYNPTFIMKISLKENTPNTTIIHFMVDYPYAIADMTHGGKQAIDTILEELLDQLDKQPRTASNEVQDTDIEIVNKDNYINTTKNRTHTPAIIIGYVLCILSFVLSAIALINYDPADIIMFTFFITGVLLLTMEISLSVVLQYYEDSKSTLHGKIQICICGLILIIYGILIHPSLLMAGIIIPVITITYFIKRAKSIE